MNTAEYIVKKLEELGVNDFFGVPGDYNFNLIYAVQDNKNTRWIGCTNELNAGYAADGYARIKGYGAVITTYGTGELRAINAVAGCMAESIPVVCIVGIPNTEIIKNEKRVHHNLFDVNYKSFFQTFEKVTAAAAFLTRDNAKIEIDRLLKIAVKEKKPVYIAIPDDIAQMEISERDISYEWISDTNILNEAAKKIADKINSADNPVILGDSLIKRFDSVIEYKDFVSKSGIPTTNLFMGTNIIDMNQPNYTGGYFSSFVNTEAENYIKNTDCLISVGVIYSDINAFGFNIPFNINDHISIYGTHAYIEGKLYDNIKMADLLEAVCELIEPRAVSNCIPDYFYKTKTTENIPLTADYIYPRIQEFIKENDIIIADTGTVMQGIALIKLPGSVVFESQALWASSGWATPAALGAIIAKPQARVIVLTGEGAHLMSAIELGNIIKFSTKTVFLVINNNGYGIERLLCKDETNELNDIIHMNYSKLPRIFGGDAWSTKVTTNEDFDKALKITQIMNKMCYIELFTSQTDFPILTRTVALQNKKILLSEKESIYTNARNPFTGKFQQIATFKKDMEYETVVHKTFCDTCSENVSVNENMNKGAE